MNVLIMVLGDRFEIFSAAAVAMVSRIPVAHLHGGESTEGAFDEAIRHSITKMSHLHFTATETYRRRVIQLGEDPERVFNVGAPGIDYIHRVDLLGKHELEAAIGLTLEPRSLLVTWHPVTLEPGKTQEQFQTLLNTLKNLDDVKLIFTNANADTQGRVINRMIDDYVTARRDTTVAHTSLGQLRYLSTLKHVDGVVGNSSSGIIEAPSLCTGTVNIGDRQRGRVRAASIIDCDSDEMSIIFNSKYLFVFASQIENESIVINLKDAGSPVLINDFSDKNSFHVVMPMKI